jgi:hypothetical protein
MFISFLRASSIFRPIIFYLGLTPRTHFILLSTKLEYNFDKLNFLEDKIDYTFLSLSARQLV